MTRLVRAALFLIGTLFALMIPLLLVMPAQAAQSGNGILVPAAATAVNGTVAVEGVAQHPGFRKWQIDLLINGDVATTRFVAVGENAIPQVGELTEFDSSRYPDGDHTLRLRVVYTGLNYDEYFTPITINNGSAPALPTEADQGDETESPEPLAPNVIDAPVSAPLGEGVPEGRRWIEVNTSDQTLTAWQGDVQVLHTSVSTGKPGFYTLPGTFNIRVKLPETRMRGYDYDTPDVPWTMYYYGGFAIHGAYWHNNFGTPVSHGCVNLRVDEAKLLFDWADVGMEVVVHD